MIELMDKKLIAFYTHNTYFLYSLIWTHGHEESMTKILVHAG